MWPGSMPLVFDPIRPERIATACDLTDPVRRVSSKAGNGFGGETARQEPEEAPVTPLDWIGRAPVASREVVSAQMRFEVDASCHVSLFHHTTARLGTTAVVVDGSAVFGSV